MNGMTNIVFDTSAAIKLLEGQYDLSSLGININGAQFLTSVVVRMKLLAKRIMLNDDERILLEFLDGLTVIPLDEAVEQTAIEIRRASRLKLPDCIVAATAIIFGALLLTDDDHLLRLSWPGFKVQKIV